MTETFNNFWQSFPTISLFGASFAEKKEVNDLVNEARRTTAVADEEARHAATALKALEITPDNALQENLTIIAVWHFERAAEKYREAAALFVRGENFRVKPRVLEHFQKKAKEAARLALEHQTTAGRLRSKNPEMFQN